MFRAGEEAVDGGHGRSVIVGGRLRLGHGLVSAGRRQRIARTEQWGGGGGGGRRRRRWRCGPSVAILAVLVIAAGQAATRQFAQRVGAAAEKVALRSPLQRLPQRQREGHPRQRSRSHRPPGISTHLHSKSID